MPLHVLYAFTRLSHSLQRAWRALLWALATSGPKKERPCALMVFPLQRSAPTTLNRRTAQGCDWKGSCAGSTRFSALTSSASVAHAAAGRALQANQPVWMVYASHALCFTMLGSGSARPSHTTQRLQRRIRCAPPCCERSQCYCLELYRQMPEACNTLW
jgi:hypothetical protein